jgi:hypothetical protein
VRGLRHQFDEERARARRPHLASTSDANENRSQAQANRVCADRAGQAAGNPSTARDLRSSRLEREESQRKWYISQAARFDDKVQWKGPYATVHRATTAIARKLAEEIIERHTARCRNYGVDD